MYIQLKYVACINCTIKQWVYKRQSLRIAKVTAAIVIVPSIKQRYLSRSSEAKRLHIRAKILAMANTSVTLNIRTAKVAMIYYSLSPICTVVDGN